MQKFKRPVSSEFLIIKHFGEAGPHYKQHIHEGTGLWIKGQICSGCQQLSPCGCLQPNAFGQHCGYDFACPIGTEVKAITKGLIIRTGIDDTFKCELGKSFRVLQMVVEDGYDTWTLIYRHLQSINVNPGTKLKSGDRLGYSGEIQPGLPPYIHVELLNKNMQFVPMDFED